MKKTLFILFLTLALCLSGCSSQASTTDNADTPTGQIDIWQGVSGDSQELTLTEKNAVALIRKDGSADLVMLRNDYIPAAQYGEQFAGYDAEMAYLTCYYGTYAIKGDNFILTMDATTYRRYDLRGADAEAFKQAYIDYQKQENPGEYADKIIEAFGKGIVTSQDDGTQTMDCTLNGQALKLLTIKYHSKDGILLSDTIMHDDGSYTSTTYFEDGTVSEVREYTSENTIVQKTVYTTGGDVEYIEKTTRDGQGNITTTRTDSNGNVIYLQESIKEKYDGGERVIQRRTENGIVTYCDITDQKDNGLTIWTFDEISGELVTHSMHITGGISEYEFSLHKVTNTGTLTEYQCQRYFAEGDVHFRHVSYISDQDVFEVTTQYRDGATNWDAIPAADYVHGEWEQYP